MITIQVFNPLSASSSDWSSYNSFRLQYHLDQEPDDIFFPDSSDNTFLKLDANNPDKKYLFYSIFSDSSLIGFLIINYYRDSSLAYEGNKESIWYELKLSRAFSSHSIRSFVLKFIFSQGSHLQKTFFISENQPSSLRSFAESIGGRVVQIHLENRLLFSDIDWSLIDRWISEGIQSNPSTKVQMIVGSIPDDLLIAYAQTFNESANQQPRGEVQEGDRVFGPSEVRKRDEDNISSGIISINCLCIESNGEISALSNILIIPENDKVFRQGLTGVPLSFRGRKLGKLSKAFMLKYLKNHYPLVESIVTGNAADNESMISINTRLGFKKYKEVITVQYTFDQLTNYFASHQIADASLVE